MLNKAIKRTSKILISLFALVACLKGYINSNIFKSHLHFLVNDVARVNVDFSDIHLNGLTRFEVKDLVIKTQDKKEAIKAKKATIVLNPFTPSRIRYIYLNDGYVLIERDGSGINLNNIVINGKRVYKKNSGIGKLEYNNMNLVFRDNSYNEKIEKKFINVSGRLYTGIQYNLDLRTIGESIGEDSGEKEKINIAILFDRVNMRKNIFDMFSLKSRKQLDANKFTINFDFYNFDVNQKLSQYIPIYDIINFRSGKLNGDLALEFSDYGLSTYGDLKISNSSVFYKDYEDIIKNVNTHVEIINNDIDLKGETNNIDGGNLNLDLKFNPKSSELSVNTNFSNVYYNTLNKYSLVKKFNLKANSDLIKGDIFAKLLIKNGDFDLIGFNGNIKTNKIEVFGTDFKNLDVNLGLKRKNMLSVETNKDANIEKNIFSNNLNLLTSLNMEYDIKKFDGKGKLKFKNLSKFINLSDIYGDFNIKDNKKVDVKLKSDQINSNINFDIVNKTISINAKNNKKLNLDLTNTKYVADNIDIKDLTWNTGNSKFTKGNLGLNIYSDSSKYFKKVNLNMNVVNEGYKIKSKIDTNNGSVSIDGITDANLNNKYKFVTNKFNLINYAKNIGIKNIGDFRSGNIDASGEINAKYSDGNISLNLMTDSFIPIIYKNQVYNINPNISDLIYSTKSKKIVDGKINLNANMSNSKYFDNIKASVRINSKGYNVDANVLVNDSNVYVSGITTKDMNHKYKIHSKSVNMFELLKKYGLLSNVSESLLKDLSGEERDLDVILNVKNKNGLFDINIDKIENQAILYKGNVINLNASVKDLLYNTKSKTLVSGKIDVSSNMPNKAYYDKLDAKVNIDNLGYNIKSNIYTNGGVVKLDGVTNRSLEHKYKLEGQSVNVVSFLKNIDMLNETDVKNKNMIYDFKVEARGKGTNIGANFEASSEYGQYSSFAYENMNIKGGTENILNSKINLSVSFDELWYNYQRLTNVKTNLEINKKEIDVLNFGNDKLKAKAKYNLDTKYTKLDLNLNGYNVYTTNATDVNVYVKDLNVNLEGKLDNLNGKLKVEDSPIFIGKNQVGVLKLDSNIEKSILNIENLKVRDYLINGSYNLSNNKFDLNLNAKEKNIHEIIGNKNIGLNIETDLKLKGDIHDINLEGHVNLNDLSYNGITIPKVYLDLDYKNGSAFDLLKTGILNIKNLEIKNKNDKTILKHSEVFDLSDLKINYNLSDKEIDFSDLDFENKGKYKGKLKINFIANIDKDNKFASVKLNSDTLTWGGLSLDGLDVDIQANNDGINISEIYLEYENNPLLVDGYMTYRLNDYNFRVLANNFNLKFLEISDKIKESGGIVNANLYFKKSKFDGNVNLDNLTLKTKDNMVNIVNLNSKVNIKNTNIEINELKGDVNEGIVDIKGRIELPTIPDNFMETKTLVLGNMDINSNLRNVRINYGNNLMLRLTSDILAKNNRIDGKVLIEEGGIYSIPSFNQKSNTNKINGYISEVFAQVINNLVNQYIVNLNVETEKSVDVNVPSILGIVKRVKGGVDGLGKLAIENGRINLQSDLNANNATFELNGHTFKVQEAYIKLDGTLDPIINFRATTELSDDQIEIGVNGRLSEKKISITSTLGKNVNEILGIIAFDETGGILSAERLRASSLLGKTLETTLNNLLLSSITNKVSSTLGISDFKITTNFDSNNTQYIGDIINNTTTTVYIQNNVLNLKNIFWNAEVTVPFDLSTVRNKLKYNAWLNYNLRKGISATTGIRSSINDINQATFYTGVEYVNRFNGFGDLFEDLSSIFKKRETLKK